MRALLIVNPRATSTTRLRRDVIASALASAVKLEVVETRYRGHATTLAASARGEGFGLVLTLGGDGTVNEAVNGILGSTELPARLPDSSGSPPASPAVSLPPSGASAAPSAVSAAPSATSRIVLPVAAELPAFAALPGGSGNVFAGALGLARDPVDATGQILQALAEGRERTIGLGNADGRYFTFNSGVGLDAEVVRAVQGLRAHGRQATPSLYVRLALRQFYKQTDRSKPVIWIDTLGQPEDPRPDRQSTDRQRSEDRSADSQVAGSYLASGEPAGGELASGELAEGQMAEGQPTEGQQSHGPVFLGIVSNTAPWTYLGGHEVNANPEARFDTGLDVFALRNMSSFSTLYALTQMLATKGGQLHGRNVLALHDQHTVTLRAERPVAFQIDGEYVGERESVKLMSVPSALRVLA